MFRYIVKLHRDWDLFGLSSKYLNLETISELGETDVDLILNFKPRR
jgi:hypothetical protein